jgi:hypothetical protein
MFLVCSATTAKRGRVVIVIIAIIAVAVTAPTHPCNHSEEREQC